MKIREQEPLCNHTTWRIGGPADRLVQPETVEELQQLVVQLQQSGQPYFVLGGGSNLLVDDAGFRGTIIKLAGGLQQLQVEGSTIYAQAGVPLPYLARRAAEHSLTGLEFAAGIPGTVGGAVVMNAGAYGSQISALVQQVLCCDRQGQLISLSREDCQFSYRNSRFKGSRQLIVVAVRLQLQSGDREQSLAQMQQNNRLRSQKQPLEYPNAGSVFQNPPGESAGRLIEQIGAKGWQQGGAMVSCKHGNFIVNTGQATCQDVRHLIDRIKEQVRMTSGIELQEEILQLKENEPIST